MTSYITAFRFTWDSQRIIDEGYVKVWFYVERLSSYTALSFTQVQGRLVQNPYLGILASRGNGYSRCRRYTPGLRRYPFLQSCVMEGTSFSIWEYLVSLMSGCCFLQFLQSDFTVGPQIRHNAYHTELIRGDLTRYLDTLFPDMHDELVLASRQIIPPDKGHKLGIIWCSASNINLMVAEWTLYSSTDTMAKLVFRTSNRIFVGPPTCDVIPLFLDMIQVKLNVAH